MKYSISTDNGNVSEHFGRCSEYTIIEVESGKLVSKQIVQNPGHQPGFLPKFLKEKGVNLVVAGGMGPKAIDLFHEENIDVILGVTGKVENVIKDIIEGKLKGGETLCVHD